MKLQITALVSAMALTALSSPAFAGFAPVIVKLAAPIPAPTKVIAGGAIFSCAGDACVAANPASTTTDFATCKVVVHAVGPATSFGVTGSPLPADRLSACNESAKK